MDNYIFPEQFERQKLEALKDRIKEEKNKLEQRIYDANMEALNYEENAKDQRIKFAAYADVEREKAERSRDDEIFTASFKGGLWGLLGSLVGVVVGIIIARAVTRKKWEKIISELEVRLQEEYKSLPTDEGIAAAKEEATRKISGYIKDHEDLCSKLTKECEAECADHRDKFNCAVNDKIGVFTDSRTVKEIVVWMTECFLETIRSADRAPEIKEIVVPFIVNVYENQVTCNAGVYDFIKHRCQLLEEDTSKAALVQTIAAALQLNVSVAMPKDITGSDATVTVEHENKIDSTEGSSALTTVTYRCLNGNYEVMKGW